MANKQVFPTKGNLIASKKSNSLAKMGYELMDRKRNILTREMMELVEDVRMLREQITDTYQRAYQALQEANMTQGVISDLAEAIRGVSVDGFMGNFHFDENGQAVYSTISYWHDGEWKNYEFR